ncbi:MAG: type 2a secretion system protein GspK [Rhodobacteraceae bacterium HLUCCA12]|nr:MAG: type 2a secretion system protein GspK [Rhodobacteraceae bacterium HLUCCA12]
MRRFRPMNRGVALINALIVVAALAAVSVALLARSDAARQRMALHLDADQAALYLDDATMLVARLIEDTSADAVHLGQPWAAPRSEVQIDRGTFGFRIADLQGRFNVNWMTRDDAMGEAARIALTALARSQGVPGAVAGRIQVALDPANQYRDSAFGGGGAISAPPPLPLASPAVLRLVSGGDGDRLDRLMPHLAALPPELGLNVNTASLPVLAALIPALSPPDLAELDETRRQQPFRHVSEFLEWVEQVMGEDAALALEALHLDVGSQWFEARLSARLDSVVLQRSAVLQRRADSRRSTVVMSMPEVD